LNWLDRGEGERLLPIFCQSLLDNQQVFLKLLCRIPRALQMVFMRDGNLSHR